MDSSKSEYNLQRVRLEESLKLIDHEIDILNHQLANISDQIRFKRIRKYELENELDELNK